MTIREGRMKAKVVLLSSFLTLAISLSAQEIVKNPDKPAAPKSGRILSLREELRISDEDGEFLLQYPRPSKTVPDDSIYGGVFLMIGVLSGI